MAVPCALVACCTTLHPKELVKQVLGESELPDVEHVLEQIEAYPWHIDTKYYTADVRLCTTETRTIGDQTFAEAVQAMVLYFDTKKEESFGQVISWLPFIKEIDPPVQILVCDRCKDSDVVSRQRTLAWCLENAFELVELEPEEESDSEEDDFQETTGVKRIIQALHAHPWPNLVMKDKPSFRSPLMNQMMAAHANNRDEDNDIENATSEPSGGRPSQQSLQTLTIDTMASNVQDLNENDTSVSDRNQSSHSSEQTSPIEPPSGRPVQTNTGVTEKLVKELRNMEAKGASGTSELLQGAVGGLGMGAVGGVVAGASLRTAGGQESKEEKKKKNEEEKQKKDGLIDSLVEDDMAMFAALSTEEEGAESFEQLFEKMRRMKEKAEALPPDQRKKYAEQVAIQFWRAMGGEEEEADGLSNSDTED